MKKKHVWIVGASVGTSTLVVAGLVIGCQDTSNTPATVGGSESEFVPAGCEFKVTGRAEFKNWRIDGPASGSGAANIRWVRLGLGGNIKAGPGYADPSTSIAIAWQTDDGAEGTEVRWGTDPDPSTWPAANSTTGITWLTPEGNLAPNGDQRMHEAYLCGLTPNTTYYYQVLSGGEQSDVYSFTTTPSDPNATVKFAVTGDSRGQHQNAWQILQRRLLAQNVTMQLFSGDMVDLAPSQYEWEAWVDKAWKDEDGQLSSLGQSLMAVTHGNHENHTPLYYGNVVLPQSVDDQPNYLEHFYSFNVGPAHVIVIDDFAVVSPTIDQGYRAVLKTWLEADLAHANTQRSEQPWIIAVHHHPEYSSSNHGTDADVLRGRAFFVPIWDQYGVDVVFTGHDHNYERTQRIKGGADIDNPTQDAAGTIYIVCAGAGADGYGSGSSAFTAFSGHYHKTVHLGLYGILEVTKTQMIWSPFWLDPSGDNPVEPPVTITK